MTISVAPQVTKTSNSPTNPVLILGAGFTALGALRAFARKGIPAYVVIDEEDDCAIRFSRWFRSPKLIRTMSQTLLSFLDSGSLTRAVIIPCSDQWVEATARLPRRLSRSFPSTIASQRSVAILLDKGHLAKTMTKLDLPHPRTILLTTAKDVAELPERAFTNFFLKPRNSFNFTKQFRVKAVMIRGRDEAIRRFNQIVRNGHQVVLQEYIPGPPTAHYLIDGFIDRTGMVRALFASRRIRMYPERFGDSTYLVSIPIAHLNRTLEDLLKLLRFVDYCGIFNAEFKYDRRDDEFKLLEVNIRPWWQIEFAQNCGVDICGLAYNDALGQTLETITDYKIGEHCAIPCLDLWSHLVGRDREPTTLSSMFCSWLGSTSLPFALDDPVPGILYCLLSSWHLAKKSFSRIGAASKNDDGGRENLPA